MATPENVYLVGFMGSGKSTIGCRLAVEMGRKFLDCDKVLVERTGIDIPYIFELEGEEGFRRRESTLLRELTERRGVVLATGGGAVVDPENRKALAANGFVVYLRASVDLLHRRTARDRNRPMLYATDPRARIAELLATREPLYLDVADLVVDTSRRSSRRVVRQITQALSD